MPRDELMQARKDRNAALLDAMVLAASADGELGRVEIKQMLDRVIERPEFEGVHAKELATLVESSAKRLAHARTFEEIALSLKHRLPNHRNRLLAFGLATSVALADRRASREELGLLKGFQAAWGLTDDEVSSVFVQLEAGDSLAEVLGEPVEQLYAETMVLVGAAAGQVGDAELQSMLENFAGDPAFQEVSVDAAEKYLKDAVQNLTSEGLPQRLTVLAHGLNSHAQRLKAFRLAARVAYSSGQPSAAEQGVLELLQITLGLSDTEVARVTGEQ